jgi:hypothetical protein
MRNFDRSVIASVLVLAGVAAAPVIACSSNDGDTPGSTSGGPGDEGGIITPPTGDGSTGTDSSVPPKKCTKSADCPSGVCNLATGLCAGAACKDGTKNGNETDIDCGGDCSQCDTGKICKVGGDCTSAVCKDTGTGLKCQAPTNTDGVKNGNETGIDCGGAANPKCADGQGCKDRADCTSDYCKANKCTAILPADGVQNGTETDVDCGGVGNARCDDALKCLVDGDCKSDVCTNPDGLGLKCQAPTPTDGKKNGTETDVDCGGGGANPACATGLNCLVGGDCTTLGCNYKFKCAAGRSCTNPGGYGADTCGYGGEGPADVVAAKDWEDCCAKAPVTATTGPTAGVTVMLDKYEVTAGRMRVFLESVGYNVRGFVQQARADGKMPLIPGNATKYVLEADWDMYLPTSFAGNQNADEISDCDQGGATSPTATTCKPGFEQPGMYTSIIHHLGGTIFKGNNQSSTGCHIGTGAIGGGTHAFRFPNGTADPPSGTPAIDQNGYDEKGMSCITYLVGQAFCVWDGGRLELGQEQIAAWGPAPMPWAAVTTQVPAEPNQRCNATACTFPTSAADCPAGLTCNGAIGKCCLQGGPPANPTQVGGGDKTYWGCRFPWATDAAHGGCGVNWPATMSIEYADYKYSYEYPKADSVLNADDYIIFISAPGRTKGRGPAGHADIIGNTFALTSNVTGVNADPQLTTHGWSSNGSFEVHNYSKPANGLGVTSNLLNKYGKLGLRCAYP